MTRFAVDAVSRGLLVGLLFAALLSFDQGWRIGVPQGMGAGIVFGICCGLLDSLFEFFQPHEHPSFPGETLLKAGAATAVVSDGAVQGWLYLTNKRLYFRSHTRRRQRHERTIALADVRGGEATRTLGLISDGLRVVTMRETEHFVVGDSKSWATTLSSAREAVDGHLGGSV